MRHGISTRLYGIVGIFSIGLVGLVLVLLFQEFGAFKERRQQELQELLDAPLSVLTEQYKLQKEGAISEAEAQARVLAIVSKLRYQGDNYFWINDRHPTMIMHPLRPDLNGKDLTTVKDPNGLALFVEFTKAVKDNGHGFVDYMWPKPGSDIPVEKSSYVVLFEPWGWIIGTGIYNDDIAAERHQAIVSAAVGGGIILILIGGIAFVTARGITHRLARLKQAMLALADGDFAVTLPDLNRHDEIASIATSVEAFRIKAVDKAKLEAEQLTSRQRETALQQEAAAARVAAEFEASVGIIVQAAMSGDFSKRVAVDGKSGLIQGVGTSINTLCENVSGALTDLGAILSALAEGDLTHRIETHYEGELAVLKDNANATAATISETLRQIRQATAEVANASSEISTSTTDLSQRTEEQAAGLEQTSASIEQMSTTVKKNAESAASARQSTQLMVEAADEGKHTVSKAIDAMARIEDSSQKISDIIGVIDEIARQTNLLALNAAVEAARAGDVGRGFAVVASEVRNLAQRASGAAKDIKDLITSSNSRVKEGVDLVNAVGGSLAKMASSISSVTDIVLGISAATGEQSTGLEEIRKAMSQMDEATQQNSALVEENAATAKALEEQAAAMDEKVGFFRLGDAVDNVAAHPQRAA